MYDQRLPIVDDDDGIWGDILRKYLLKEHYDTGADNPDNGGHKNVTIRPGTAGVGGAPLKFTTGTLLTTPEAGAMEFVLDNLYLTQNSGTRKKIALYDVTGATGDMYYRNGSNDFTRLAAGTASQILTISGGVPTWQTPGASTSTFADGSFVLQNTAAPTKEARFDLASITAGQRRVFTLPDANATLVGTATSQTLSGKTLTAPRFASGGFIADNSGNEQIVFTTTASAVNEIGVTNAATGNAPQITARGGDANVNLNLVPKGTGRVQANGVNIPTTTSADTLTNKIINAGDNTLTNIPWSAVTKPAVIAAGATIGEALNNVNLTPIVGGSSSSVGREYGAYARNALYSHPESEYFVPIPHLYNDIAYNNDRGGSVTVRHNGSVVAADGNHALEVFTPDANYSFVNFYTSTSDTVELEITLHRTFYWNYRYGIQQTDWCRGQNVKFETYNGTSWSTISDKSNEPTGLTWSDADAGSGGITKIRFTISNFNVPASTGARVTQVFLIGFDSSLLSGTFLPRGGGQLYGELATPAVWTDRIKDRSTGVGILEFYHNASAVNYLQIQNNASGSAPAITAQGANANIGINLIPKGTGRVQANNVNIPTTSSADTLTNKTIDASNNPISNLTTSSIAAATLVTAAEGITSNNNDTTLPTSAAVKSYVDSAAGSSAVPYDLSIIAFGTYTARVANSYGDFPMGIKLQRAVTFTQVVYRVNTPDASGNLVVQLRKNGSTVSGTSATIAAANQVAGGTATGSWAFAAGDILTVYITGIGSSPGAGLIADIRGDTT